MFRSISFLVTARSSSLSLHGFFLHVPRKYIQGCFDISDRCCKQLSSQNKLRSDGHGYRGTSAGGQRSARIAAQGKRYSARFAAVSSTLTYITKQFKNK
jgi:hypothetical protein